jgi:hypothetical protein
LYRFVSPGTRWTLGKAAHCSRRVDLQGDGLSKSSHLFGVRWGNFPVYIDEEADELLQEKIKNVWSTRHAEDLREIESAASKITVQGARYPERLEQMTGR